jgi:mono/diheme cytochrome c family protein
MTSRHETAIELALAGDWGKYVDGLAGIPAWSAALQGKLPGSQHLLALEVSNVPTNTPGGTAQSAASAGDLFVGFAFSASLKPRLLKMLVPDFLAPPPESKQESPAEASEAAEPAAAAPPGPAPVAAPPQADAAALISRGKKLFDADAAGQGCAACHEAKDLAGTGLSALRSAFKSDSMSDFKTLKESDLLALEAFLKSLKK